MPQSSTSRTETLSRAIKYASEHIQLILAAFSLLGLFYYFCLVAVEQHTYGMLDIRPAEVGIDRGRLLEETVPATSVLVAGFAVIFGVMMIAILSLFPRLAASPFSWLAVFSVVMVLVPAGVMWLIGKAGSTMAANVMAGKTTNGLIKAKLHLIDLDASPFVFTRLSRRHRFDRGCMLYLGQADGQLVMYDVAGGVSLRLPADEYAGEARGATGRGVGLRCGFTPAKGDSPIANASRVEDVDAAGGVVVWSARDASGPWQLLMSAVRGPRLLTRSTRRLAPDLGRDVHGRLLVSYRSCAAGRCAFRLRRLPGADRSEAMPAPNRPGCVAGAAASATGVTAVALRGERCNVGDRGIWTRRPGGRWRRIPSSGLATEELDALGGRVVWIDRRGTFSRVRVADGRDRPTTLFSTEQPISSVRLTAAGAMWAVRTAERDDYTLTMHRWDHGGDCPAGVRVPPGSSDLAHVAPVGSRLVVASESRVLTRAGSDKAFAAAQSCFER